MVNNKFHPGVFIQELLDNYDITAYKLSKDIFVNQTRISEIINNKRSISSDTAMRLAKYFNTSASYWLNLQDSYNLSNCNTEDYKNIERIKIA